MLRQRQTHSSAGAPGRMSIHQPPGRLVDVGGHRLHVQEAGAGDPCIVFEAGMPASSINWAALHEALSGLTRVVSYDRAGFAWSEPGRFPRTAGRIVQELAALLERAEVAGPYLLVGHSFGAFTTRLFASLYPEHVMGLLLLDPIHPEDWVRPDEQRQRMIAGGVTGCYRGARLAHVGIASLIERLVRLRAVGLARALVNRLTAGAADRLEKRAGPLGRIDPRYRGVARKFLTLPRFWEAMGSQIGHLPYSAGEVLETATLVDFPVVVISARDAAADQLSAHRNFVRRFPRGRHLSSARAGHWIHLDDPELVVRVIQEMVANYRGVPAE